MSKEIQIMTQLYEARQVIKRYWDDKYTDKVSECSLVLKQVQAANNCAVLPALIVCMKRLQEHGHDTGMHQALFMAAAVEMLGKEGK